MSPTETQLFLSLLQNDSVARERLDKSSNCIAVHVFRLRRQLRPHGISIVTFYDHGYKIPPEDRKKALDLILSAVPRAASA